MTDNFPAVADDYKEYRLAYRCSKISRKYGQKIFQAIDCSHYFIVDTDRSPTNQDNVLLNFDGINRVGRYIQSPKHIELSDGLAIIGKAIQPSYIIGIISSIVSDIK